MKRNLLICFLLIISANVLGQATSTEELRDQLRHHPQQDTFRVNRLIALGKVAGSALSIEKQDEIAYEAVYISKKFHYLKGEGYGLVNLADVKSQKGEQQRADSLLQEAGIIARKIPDQELLVNVLLGMGNIKRLNGENKLALSYFLRAEVAAHKLPNTKLLALCQDRLSDFYANALADYLTALEWSYKSIKTSEAANCQPCLVRSWAGIASLYTSVSDSVNSLYYYKKALQANEKLGDKFTESILLNNIGEDYRINGNYAEAIKAYMGALAITKKPVDIEINESDLADAYEKQGNLPMAFKYGFSSHAASKKLGDDETRAWIDGILGHAYLKINKPDSVLFYGEEGFAAAKKVGNIESLRDNSENLNKAYAMKKDFANAYKYLKLYVSYPNTKSNDSIKNISNLTKYNYNLEKKQSQIASLNKEKELQGYFITSVLIALGLIVVTVIVLVRNNRRQIKANSLLSKQKKLIEQQRDQTNLALSELKLTQNQLIQSEKMVSLGELTAGIAHEIQNPLNFVNNFSDVSKELLEEMMEELAKGDITEATSLANNVVQNLDKIHNHGKRADFIVKGMLMHSRHGTTGLQPTNLNMLVDEFLKLSYYGIRAKNKLFNADLVLNLDTGLPDVNVAQQDIGRVLLNLFNNAFYSIEQKQKTAGAEYKPTIEVSTRLKNQFVEIRVRDNGNGIPENIRNKIMQPFFTTKPTGEGTGLGLSLSYDIVVQGHNGSIYVISKESEYAEFVITLPAQEEFKLA
jgi:signal transduction histidine kinase